MKAFTRYRFCLVAVFLIAMGLRVYWLTQKAGFHGDELTSICIAYNGVDNQGDLAFEAHHVYTGNELNRFFVDQEGGIEGLRNDIVALWNDNHDVPHAALYYMLLRLALTGVHDASIHQAILWGCLLGLVLFSLTFWAAARMLEEHSPEGTWIPYALAIGFLNSVSVSNTLFLRDYVLAELAIILLFWRVLRLNDRFDRGLSPWHLATVASSVGAAVLALSSGYVNGLLALFLSIWLVARRKNGNGVTRKQVILFLVVVMAASLAVCWLIYTGFFRFTLDPRISETAVAFSPASAWTACISTLKALTGLAALRLFTPLGVIVLAASFWKKSRGAVRPSGIPAGAWFCVILWAAIYWALVPWKSERFIAPALPIILFGLTPLLGRLQPLAALFTLVTGTQAAHISYIRPTNLIPPPTCHRTLLLAADHEERKSAQMLAGWLRPNQELLVVERMDDIGEYVSPVDTTFLLVTDRSTPLSPALLRHYEVVRSGTFNTWMTFYELQRRTVTH